MATSVTMGRPKIEGLTPINLRLLASDLAALDRIVIAERARRRDPALTRTDIIREALNAYARKHDPDAKG